jgi:hypothetical protein
MAPPPKRRTFPGWHPLRCQRYQCASRFEGAQQGKACIIERSYPVRVVHTAIARIQVGSFEMNTGYGRQASCQRIGNGADAHLHRFRIVTDERRQASRRAVATMCRDDSLQRFNCRRVIEQDTASAIHLQVYESWCQQMAAKIQDVRILPHIIRRENPGNPAAIDQHRTTFAQGFAVEQFAIGE